MVSIMRFPHLLSPCLFAVIWWLYILIAPRRYQSGLSWHTRRHLAMDLARLGTPSEHGGDSVGDGGGATIDEALLHTIPHGVDPLESSAERRVENATKVGDCRPVAVPYASVVGTSIVDAEHGEEDQDTLDEADDLGLPVFAGVGPEDRWLKPPRVAHGLLVSREDPGGELLLDDLATVIIPAAKPEFSGVGGDSGGTRCHEQDVLGIGPLKPVRMVLAAELHRHRREHVLGRISAGRERLVQRVQCRFFISRRRHGNYVL